MYCPSIRRLPRARNGLSRSGARRSRLAAERVGPLEDYFVLLVHPLVRLLDARILGTQPHVHVGRVVELLLLLHLNILVTDRHTCSRSGPAKHAYDRGFCRPLGVVYRLLELVSSVYNLFRSNSGPRGAPVKATTNNYNFHSSLSNKDRNGKDCRSI